MKRIILLLFPLALIMSPPVWGNTAGKPILEGHSHIIRFKLKNGKTIKGPLVAVSDSLILVTRYIDSEKFNIYYPISELEDIKVRKRVSVELVILPMVRDSTSGYWGDSKLMDAIRLIIALFVVIELIVGLFIIISRRIRNPWQKVNIEELRFLT